MIDLGWLSLSFLFQTAFSLNIFFQIAFLNSVCFVMALNLLNYSIGFMRLVVPISFLNYFSLLNQYISYKIFDVFLIHWHRHLNLGLNFLDSLRLFRNLFYLYFFAFFVVNFLLNYSHPVYFFVIFLNFFLNFL
jgi:hypothetical protein